MNKNKTFYSSIRRRVSSRGNEYFYIVYNYDSIIIRIDIAKGRFKDFINKIDFKFINYNNYRYTNEYYNENLTTTRLNEVLTYDFINAINKIFDIENIKFEEREKEAVSKHIQNFYSNTKFNHHFI
jgi:hypothetical protein